MEEIEVDPVRTDADDGSVFSDDSKGVSMHPARMTPSKRKFSEYLGLRYVTSALLLVVFDTFAWAAPALNPDVTPATIQQTICQSGYTKTVRPSTIYTNGIKFRLMREAGIDASSAHDLALDHIIALALGGHPRSLENLQLLTAKENSRKSRIEVKLQCMVCTGEVTLETAQREMYDDWKAAYSKYAGQKCHRSKHGLE